MSACGLADIRGTAAFCLLLGNSGHDCGTAARLRLAARRAVASESLFTGSIIRDLLRAHVADVTARLRPARFAVRAPLAAPAPVARTVLGTRARMAGGMIDHGALADDCVCNVAVGLRGGRTGQQRPKDQGPDRKTDDKSKRQRQRAHNTVAPGARSEIEAATVRLKKGNPTHGWHCNPKELSNRRPLRQRGYAATRANAMAAFKAA